MAFVFSKFMLWGVFKKAFQQFYNSCIKFILQHFYTILKLHIYKNSNKEFKIMVTSTKLNTSFNKQCS